MINRLKEYTNPMLQYIYNSIHHQKMDNMPNVNKSNIKLSQSIMTVKKNTSIARTSKQEYIHGPQCSHEQHKTYLNIND